MNGRLGSLFTGAGGLDMGVCSVLDVPGVSRNDALKICGNGVVPQQAAAAIRSLLSSAVAA